MQVLVRDNNVDQALKALKKKMQREGIFREMKLRGHYEKPSEKKARERAEAIRRARKLARKKLQREGLLPMKPRVVPGGPGGPGGAMGGRAAPRRGRLNFSNVCGGVELFGSLFCAASALWTRSALAVQDERPHHLRQAVGVVIVMAGIGQADELLRSRDQFVKPLADK